MSIVSGGKWLCCVSVPGAGSWTSSNSPWEEFVASAHLARKVEAAFFARTYAPTLVAEILPKWKQQLIDRDQAKIADS